MAESTLDELSTEQLRERAFARARQRHDLGFYWDVVQHLPHAPEAQDVDGSLGSLGAAIDSVTALWHELTGHDADYGAAEPLLRAKFIDYLSEPERTS